MLKTVCGRQRAPATRTSMHYKEMTMQSNHKLQVIVVLTIISVKFILNCNYIAFSCICMWYKDNIDNNDDNLLIILKIDMLKMKRTATMATASFFCDK